MGRSALTGGVMDVGWNFRRSTSPLSAFALRHHNAATSPNVVPSECERVVLFPRTRLQHIKGLREIGDAMAQGAAI